MRATKVNAGLAESNGRLLLGKWRDSLHVTCGLTACTPGSAPGPTLGNEYGKTLPFFYFVNCGKLAIKIWNSISIHLEGVTAPCKNEQINILRTQFTVVNSQRYSNCGIKTVLIK